MWPVVIVNELGYYRKEAYHIYLLSKRDLIVSPEIIEILCRFYFLGVKLNYSKILCKKKQWAGILTNT